MSQDELYFPSGDWQLLLAKAYRLIFNLEAAGVVIPQWSLGGGTVLMFHYQHRLSKDIDIFVPDPQFLGYVTPRLSEAAEQLTTEYDETANCVKLRLAEGEIDFIATQALTNEPFLAYDVMGKNILLESPIEIVAKKIWHRGNLATARDLFDLALVIEKERDKLISYQAIFMRTMDIFISQCKSRRAILEPAFEQIRRLNFSKTYDECLRIVHDFFISDSQS